MNPRPSLRRRRSGGSRSAAFALMLFTTFAVQELRAADGAREFRNACGPCHSANVVHRIGPSLVGIVGRVSGTARDFEYSEPMKKAAITWDKASLERFLTTPNSVVAGSKMSYPGLKDEEKRKAIVEYIGALRAE